jgi:hypothetical protein
LVSAAIDPGSTDDDQVSGSQAGANLRFFRCGDEAMVYVVAKSRGVEVLIAGHAANREDEGRLILEAEVRASRGRDG